MADGVEYIKVSAIGSQNDWSAFRRFWDSLPSKNTRAVILDLRGNGGGLIDAALKMANVMTPVKECRACRRCATAMIGRLEQTYSTGNALPLGKIVVLVDGGTASAAELLAGSLQDTGSATLIGSKTYGKGQGQFHIDLVKRRQLVITTLELRAAQAGLLGGCRPDAGYPAGKPQGYGQYQGSQTARYEHNPAFWRQLGRAVYAMTERLSPLDCSPKQPAGMTAT